MALSAPDSAEILTSSKDFSASTWYCLISCSEWLSGLITSRYLSIALIARMEAAFMFFVKVGFHFDGAGRRPELAATDWSAFCVEVEPISILSSDTLID